MQDVGAPCKSTELNDFNLLYIVGKFYMNNCTYKFNCTGQVTPPYLYTSVIK